MLKVCQFDVEILECIHSIKEGNSKFPDTVSKKLKKDLANKHDGNGNIVKIATDYMEGRYKYFESKGINVNNLREQLGGGGMLGNQNAYVYHLSSLGPYIPTVYSRHIEGTQSKKSTSTHIIYLLAVMAHVLIMKQYIQQRPVCNDQVYKRMVLQ